MKKKNMLGILITTLAFATAGAFTVKKRSK